MSLTRRRLLSRFLGGLVAFSSFRIARLARAADEPLCSLSPEQEQGPFFIPDEKLRADLIEDRAGIPLYLKIRLVEAQDCTALRGASVEIWSCDAQGIYSGYDAMPLAGPGGPPPEAVGSPGPMGHADGPPPGAPKATNDQTFLRGVLATDTDGEVEFTTLYPGCYAGRTNHIHVRVRTAGRDGSAGHLSHLGQIFFAEDLSTEVLATEPYRSNPVTRTMFATDPVYCKQHGERCMARYLKVKEKDLREGIRALITFNVDSHATPAPVGGMGPPS